MSDSLKATLAGKADTTYVDGIEAGRAAAEADRATAESARVAAETARQAAFDTAIADANTQLTQAQAIAEAAADTANAAEDLSVTVQAEEDLRVAAEQVRVTAETSRSQAEQARGAAEQGRATAEQNRVTAEQGRVTAEQNRVTAENSRVTKETSRVNAEAARVTAETARKQAFDTAIAGANAELSTAQALSANITAAEDARIAAETVRGTNEAARIQDEAARSTNETNRDANEAVRQLDEATRQSNEVTRVSSETARVASMADIQNRWNALNSAVQDDAEVINARTSTAKAKTFNRLTDRFEELETDAASPKYSTEQVITSGIGSVPANVMKGQFSEVKVLGNTYTSSIQNGNFVSASGWSGAGATLSANNNILTITGVGDSSAPRANTHSNIPCITGKKVFIRFKAKCLHVGANKIDVYIAGTGGGALFASLVGSPAILNPVQNTLYAYTGVVTLPSNFIGALDIAVSHVYADSVAANGKVMEVQEVMAIDLAAHGLDSLTADQCNQRFPYWFDGTKSTFSSGGKIVSQGKNWFDKSTNDKILNSYINSGGAIADGVGSDVVTIPILPNVIFTRSNFGARHRFLDANKNYINISSADTTFTTPSNSAYVQITILIPSYDIAQLEFGALVTSYEQYLGKSEAYTPTGDVLRSLPNGTKDEYNATTGVETQNVSDDVDITTSLSSADLSTNRITRIYNPTNFKIGLGTTRLLDKTTGQVMQEVPESENNLTSSQGKYCVKKTDGGIFLVTETGVAPTVNHVLNYQLAEPVVTQVAQPQNLMAYPNGTIYVEPVVKQTKAYGAKLEAVADAPIQAVESVYKIVDNVPTAVPLTDVTVAADKLSISITGAQPNDIYEWVYEYDSSLTTLPEVRYTVGINMKAQVEQNSVSVASALSQIHDLNDFTVAMLLNHETRLTLLEVV
jgi:hypothetical protein